MRCVAVYSRRWCWKNGDAVNLGYLAAASGLRVLLWDLDLRRQYVYLRVKAEKGGTRKLLGNKSKLDGLIKASDFERLHLLPARFRSARPTFSSPR